MAKYPKANPARPGQKHRKNTSKKHMRSSSRNQMGVLSRKLKKNPKMTTQQAVDSIIGPKPPRRRGPKSKG